MTASGSSRAARQAPDGEVEVEMALAYADRIGDGPVGMAHAMVVTLAAEVRRLRAAAPPTDQTMIRATSSASVEAGDSHRADGTPTTSDTALRAAETPDALTRECLAALHAVVGRGYCENNGAGASQDYVSKLAIAAVRAAIARAGSERNYDY